MEVGIEESAESGLFDYDIIGVGCYLINYLCSVGACDAYWVALGEKVPAEWLGVDSRWVMNAVDVYDGPIVCTGVVEESAECRQGGIGSGYLEWCIGEHEVVLHVNDENGVAGMRHDYITHGFYFFRVA